MALQTPCTGKEIIDEINSISGVIDSSMEYIGSRLQTTIEDGFHIGDLLYTPKTELGDKYLLCNGATLYNWGEYSDLIPYIDGDASIWYHKHEKGDKGGVLYAVNSSIYWVYTEANNIYAVKYENIEYLVKDEGSTPTLIYSHESSDSKLIIRGQCEFNKNIYLQFTVDTSEIKIITSPVSNILSMWEEVLSESGINPYSFACDSKQLCLIRLLRVYDSQYIKYHYYLEARATVNGYSFSEISQEEVASLENYDFSSAYIDGISIIDGVLYINFFAYGNNSGYGSGLYMYELLYSNITPFGNVSKYGGAVSTDFMFDISGAPGKYNGNIYIHAIHRSSGTHYIYPITGSYSGGLGIYEIPISGAGQKLISRNETLYLFGGTSGFNSGIYQVRFTESAAFLSPLSLKSRKDAKFASENGFQVSESNNLYIYPNGEIVPKESGVISSLPTISPDVGYAYIKAKE